MQTKGVDVPSLEMKKWFDTNYHYMVTRFAATTTFKLATGAANKPVAEFKEALALGIKTRPVILGPGLLKAAGATHVQIDEPVLVLDLTAQARAAFESAYAFLAPTLSGLDVTLATYFGGIAHHADLVAQLPGINTIHIDLVRSANQLDAVISAVKPTHKSVSLGLINGRNIWRADIHHALTLARHAIDALDGNHARVTVAPSCSLLHSPVSLAGETNGSLDDEIKTWLAFAVEKLAEVRLVQRALTEGSNAVADELVENHKAIASRRSSARIHNPSVKARVEALQPKDFTRPAEFPARWALQQAKLNLPAFPTTTVGSFPQTKEVRAARAAWKKEDLGLDMLVHGEFERNDMVEFFGELLDGYAFTKNGWVQSYGSRCVKPPVIFGDVARPKPMTVDMITLAQKMTPKPMKGMLTGPITMLQWSFVRDDQPRRTTAFQLALAIRDEVVDLEAAGIKAIQIDEPAIREGLPLRRVDYEEYLQWSVDAFKLSASGVRDETQIHSHMCYSSFEEIMDAIIRMDVDVLSIESAKSDLKLLSAFDTHAYPNHLGPGLYDIHSPRVPSVEEMVLRAKAILACLPHARQAWINPDCGLKTRGWTEVRESLRNLVTVACQLRESVNVSSDHSTVPVKKVVGGGVDTRGEDEVANVTA
ncbi:cobalamin-independent synthase [Catenaria anguillulae PL171]|uniref:5-methyltetrahydropteroyltriglutamate--homocysteine S-methyltransferase n=1 Tax=Catenaria anguillulae PL171 TaxID=765915 RepID=A0A1Y2HZ78_9FUNG|nr:cobalamin-independent synthase [Catenaria anguillulae PL171]